MDIPSFITAYGGPGGFVGIIIWLFILDRRHHGDRRDELRKDLELSNLEKDRLRTANSSLRKERDDERRIRFQAEDELQKCRYESIIRGEVEP